MKNYRLKIYTLIIISIFSVQITAAQSIKTAYFMNKSTVQTALNPAFQPEKSFISFPFIGAMNIGYNGNVALSSFLFNNSNNDLVLFSDKSVNSEMFLSKLSKNNKVDANISMGLFNMGLRRGKSYWTVNLDVKFNSGASLPKSLFEFIKNGAGVDGDLHNLNNLNFNINTRAEFAVGYSRQINSKLTVGGKVKLLMGIADVDMHIEEMRLRFAADEWSATSSGYIMGSMGGIKAKTTLNSDGVSVFEGFDLDPSGLGGIGASVDLGAVYNVIPNLKVSASVIDLGFINWSAKNTVNGNASANYTFSGFEIANGAIYEEPMDDFSELTEFQIGESKDRTQSLETTILVGAEYSFFAEKLSAGVLYTNKIGVINNYSEFTFSGNWRPLKWLHTTVSYSILEDNSSIGAAINIVTKGLNLFVGTDYIVGDITPQFIPINATSPNIYFGLAFSFGKCN